MLGHAVLKPDELFVKTEFIDSDLAFEIRNEVDSSRQYTTPLEDVEQRVERKVPVAGRPKSVFDINERISTKLSERFLAIRKEMARFFDTDLGELKDPYYLVYREGEYLDRHVDAINGMEHPVAPSTEVAFVVFLNDHDEFGSPGSFTGGDLTIYGIIGNQDFEGFGYPIKGKTGTLVAFRATRLHEVTKVASGKRYVINSGFY